MTTSQSSIFGIFKDYSTAQTVARELEQGGIPREDIQIQSNHATGAAGHSAPNGESGNGQHEGGIAGFFNRIFGSADEHVEDYSDAVDSGRSVVVVTADAATMDHAVAIMSQHEPVDLDKRDTTQRPTGGRDQFQDHTGARSIPVIEEELQIGKRVVSRGGVRVYSHVVEEPVEESVTLREEHVRVQRRPVDRPMNPNDAAAMRDQSIEVAETVEEPVITKTARVREEVVINKETTQRTEQILDKVRRTKVEVEQMNEPGSATGAVQDSSDFRRHYEANFASSGVPYRDLAPAYEYGSQAAGESMYRGKSWSDVESVLKTDYLRQNPNSKWDNAKGAVRYGWEKVTGQR